MAENFEQPPFFQGMAPFAWRPNRLYRVYVLPGELVFIYAGSGGELSAAAGAQFGLLGGLLAAATSPAKKNRERQQRLDGAQLDELVADHKHNFRAPATDLTGVSLDPRSFWLAAMYQQPSHAGVLRFTHVKKGKMQLCIGSVEEMKVAVESVPPALGGRVAVNVEWNERKRKFVKK
jgi:hypothetical protein